MWVAAAPLLLATTALALLSDPARSLPATLGLLTAGFGALVWASRRLRTGGVALEPRALAQGLAVAATLRVLALTLSPTLSNDLERYLWDGSVVLSGANPYRLAPEDLSLEPLRDERWARLHHRGVPTVYPPLALGLFTLAVPSPAPGLTLRALLALADLGGCWALGRLARRRALGLGAWAWYAWNPLPVLEGAGMGHVDVLGVALTLGALHLATRARSAASGVAVGLGVLAKYAPIVALPLLARASARPRRLVVIALGVAAAGLLPVVLSTGVPPGLITFGVSWEFNGPFYEPLWRLLAATGADRLAADVVDSLKEATDFHSGWNRLYPILYPQLLAKLVLAAGMLPVVVRAWRAGTTERGLERLFGGLLLCSATVYPWYVLWALPWAVLTSGWAWRILSASVLLSYLAQMRALELFPLVWAAVWGPFVLGLWLDRRRRRRVPEEASAWSQPSTS